MSATYDPAEVEAYIRRVAPKYHIDPDQAVAVAQSEGLHGYVGDDNSSFGPYQLHYGNVAAGGNAVGGMGDDFTHMTGKDARDPSTVHDQIDFALSNAEKNGWGAWHGWKGSAMSGIGDNPMDSVVNKAVPPTSAAAAPVASSVQAPPAPGIGSAAAPQGTAQTPMQNQLDQVLSSLKGSTSSPQQPAQAPNPVAVSQGMQQAQAAQRAMMIQQGAAAMMAKLAGGAGV